MSFPQSQHLEEGTGFVGIITLWTPKEHITKHLQPSSYRVISQLYSRDEGISLFVRSLLAHPEITDIILVGSDLNGCSDVLLSLWEHGAENGIITGGGYIDAEIPCEIIDELITNVSLHDLRTKPLEELESYIMSIPQKKAWSAPRTFPQASIQEPTTFPTHNQHRVRAATIEDAARDIAKRIKRFGTLHNILVHTQEQEVIIHETLAFDEFIDLRDGCYFIKEIRPSQQVTTYAKKPRRPQKFGDPRGNFIIRIREDKIIVTHLAPDGKRMQEFSGTSAQMLYKKICFEQRLTDLDHAAYIGYELARAELALQNGEWYEQDTTVRKD